MNRKILFYFLVFFWLSCSNNKYKDFSQTPTGLHYRLITLGDGNPPRKGDIISASIIIFSRDRDTVFNSTTPITFTFNDKPYADEFLSILNEGDSAEFIINSGKFRNNSTKIDLGIPIDNVELLMRVGIKKIRNAEEYEYEKIWEQEDPEMQEQELIKIFLKENNIIGSNFYKSGIYFLPINHIEHSDSIISGSVVTFHITGTFLNGKVFDSSVLRNQPLEIVFGKPLQIIKGLEIALKGMKKGEKAKIIIPSQLAFGNEGSVGIIPPYTTLVYDIEILTIKN